MTEMRVKKRSGVIYEAPPSVRQYGMTDDQKDNRCTDCQRPFEDIWKDPIRFFDQRTQSVARLHRSCWNKRTHPSSEVTLLNGREEVSE